LIEVLSGLPPEVKLAFAKGKNFLEPSELADLAPESPTTEIHSNFVSTVKNNLASRYGACNAAIRRESFIELGGFELELKCAEDTDLFLRVAGSTAFIGGPILVGLRRSGHVSLTANIIEVKKGFEWMKSRLVSDTYQGRVEDVRSFVSGSCAYSIRAAFAAGFISIAYRLYFSNLILLFNIRTRKYLVRLPLTPLLHLIKPQAYPFRMSPARTSGVTNGP
jgi:hypothetical protein